MEKWLRGPLPSVLEMVRGIAKIQSVRGLRGQYYLSVSEEELYQVDKVYRKLLAIVGERWLRE